MMQSARTAKQIGAIIRRAWRSAEPGCAWRKDWNASSHDL